jgi:hypothetical protein
MKRSLATAVVPAMALVMIQFMPSPGVAAAPDELPPVVRPGDGVVDGSRFEPYRNAWNYTRRSATGDVELEGRWTDNLSFVEEGGVELIVRRQEIPTAEGNRVLINRARRSDLLPLSFEFLTDEGQTLQRIDFESTTLLVTAGGQEPVSVDLSEPVFDWYLYGVLIAAFPLEEGYEVRFPGLTATLDSILRRLAVVARESIPSADGTPTQCWKVDTDERLTFWISENAPYILRVYKQLEDGGSLSWEIEQPPADGPRSRLFHREN